MKHSYTQPVISMGITKSSPRTFSTSQIKGLPISSVSGVGWPLLKGEGNSTRTVTKNWSKLEQLFFGHFFVVVRFARLQRETIVNY